MLEPRKNPEENDERGKCRGQKHRYSAAHQSINRKMLYLGIRGDVV